MEKGITMLVVDSDTEYARGLTQYARGREEFLDSEYATNGVDGFKLVEIVKPDVIVMDFLVVGLDVIGFMRQIKSISVDYRPRMVINSQMMAATMLRTVAEHGADYFMVKPQPYNEVCNTVAELFGNERECAQLTLRSSEDGVDVKITRFLHYMGVPAHLNGYKYLRTALRLAMEDMSMVVPITRRLYPELGGRFKKSPECIERSIRHAISVSWERGNKKMLNDIFGYSIDSGYRGYPTNSEYIAMVADELNMRMKHNLEI